MLSLIAAYRKTDPAAKSALEILLLYPGVKALAFHRMAHPLYRLKLFFGARLLSETARFLTGIEIHPGAKIGKNLVIDHGLGVVVGETAEVGDNVTLYQGVTLGGTTLDGVKRHPIIKNNVIIGSGAKVLGRITIGEGARVGANAVVLDDVKPNTSVVGVPAK